MSAKKKPISSTILATLKFGKMTTTYTESPTQIDYNSIAQDIKDRLAVNPCLVLTADGLDYRSELEVHGLLDGWKMICDQIATTLEWLVENAE